jgi:hypothetical protein
VDKNLNSVEVCPPETSNKFELNERMHFVTKQLLYTHITQLVVEGSELTRILAQFMLRCFRLLISKEQTDWQTFPKNIKVMRIQSTKTIESEILSGFPEMADRP